jgi:hypothetical protein
MNAVLPTGNEAVVFFAEQLGKHRALDDREVRVLKLAISRDRGSHRRWTSAEDASLLKMHKARIRCVDIAAALKRSEAAVFTRIRDLKKAARVKCNGR